MVRGAQNWARNRGAKDSNASDDPDGEQGSTAQSMRENPPGKQVPIETSDRISLPARRSSPGIGVGRSHAFGINGKGRRRPLDRAENLPFSSRRGAPWPAEAINGRSKLWMRRERGDASPQSNDGGARHRSPSMSAPRATPRSVGHANPEILSALSLLNTDGDAGARSGGWDGIDDLPSIRLLGR